MDSTAILFFDLIVVISALTVALGMMSFYAFRASRRSHIPNKSKDEISKNNAVVLDEARAKAIRIIDDANSQALDIISRAKLFGNATSDTFKANLSEISSNQIKEFDKTSSNFTESYLQVLQDLKAKNIEVFQSISKTIEADTIAEIKDFKNSMQKLTISSQNEIKRMLGTDYETLRADIGSYKKTRLQEVDAEVYQILEKIAKLVLGKALSLSEHQELIEKSIEKAKKEGVLEEIK